MFAARARCVVGRPLPSALGKPARCSPREKHRTLERQVTSETWSRSRSHIRQNQPGPTRRAVPFRPQVRAASPPPDPLLSRGSQVRVLPGALAHPASAGDVLLSAFRIGAARVPQKSRKGAAGGVSSGWFGQRPRVPGRRRPRVGLVREVPPRRRTAGQEADRTGSDGARACAGGDVLGRTAQTWLDDLLAEARARAGALPGARGVGVLFDEAAAEWLRYVEHGRAVKPSNAPPPSQNPSRRCRRPSRSRPRPCR